MINFVEIRNWRSYKDFAINLNSKVVFFVTPNGVGKTSLIEAVRWCLIGKLGFSKVKSAIRDNDQPTSVKVALTLLSKEKKSKLQVERSLPKGFKDKEEVTFTATLDDEEISEESYTKIITDAWRANFTVIDNLMFPSSKLYTQKTQNSISNHLSNLLGITEINKILELLKDEKENSKNSIADLEEKVNELKNISSSINNSVNLESDITVELENYKTRFKNLNSKIEIAESDVALAQLWEKFRETSASYSKLLEEIIQDLRPEINVSTYSAFEDILQAQSDTTELVKKLLQEKANYDVSRARTETASEQLLEGIDKCPTCLRYLDDVDRESACKTHALAMENFDTEIAYNAEAMTKANFLANQLTTSLARLSTLQQPLPPTKQDPGIAVINHLELLRSEKNALEAEIYQMQQKAANNDSMEVFRNTLRRENANLERIAKRDLVLGTMISALEDMAQKATEERFNPIAEELSKVWESFFDAHELALRSSLKIGINSPSGKKLRTDDLSGGEGSSLDLFTRLLITDKATEIPTIWFDEPLERLDPRRREELATMLVSAGQADSVVQIIMTTFESEIAHKLEDIFPETVLVAHADLN